VAGIADCKVKHHAQQFTFVVVRNAALGAAVVAVAFEPCIETGFLRRLREMRRAALEFCDLLAQPIEILLFVNLSGPQSNDSLNRTRYSFAEPKGARVILLCVVDRLKGLGANAFDVP
jgi:hypothetical protein